MTVTCVAPYHATPSHTYVEAMMAMQEQMAYTGTTNKIRKMYFCVRGKL